MENTKEELSFSEQMIGHKINMVGYFIHILGVERPETYLDIHPQAKEMQSKLQGIGRILAIGPEAFKDKNQTKVCQEGDYVWYWTHERTWDPIRFEDKIVNTYTITDDHIRAILTPEQAQTLLRTRK